MNKKFIKSVFFALVITSSTVCFAQDNLGFKLNGEKTYEQVVLQRADKITSQLGIADSVKYNKVNTVIFNQYKKLNTHHEQKDEALKLVKEKYKENSDKLSANLKKTENKFEIELAKIHNKYIKDLSKELNDSQITKVKDAMTYNVLPNTYKAYQEMLPNLTAVQKEKILGFLTEARENAMDASSSKAKHAWFGKYKGRINNYLSAEGVDMKKASIEWQERIKANK